MSIKLEHFSVPTPDNSSTRVATIGRKSVDES